MMPETQEWINKAEGDWKVAGREGVLSASTDNTTAGKIGQRDWVRVKGPVTHLTIRKVE